MEEYKVRYYDNGTTEYESWYKDGKLHRLDGPSYISYNLDGSKHYEAWCNDGEYHRLDGPAQISYYSNGNKSYKEWYKDGLYHREDGPALISYYDDGSTNYETWYLCDQEYTKFEHRELVKLGKTIITRDAAIMNIKHPSEYIHMRCQEVLNGRA
jgi:antitoxin component YwqK of YwqJK toxin-antitoxin module